MPDKKMPPVSAGAGGASALQTAANVSARLHDTPARAEVQTSAVRVTSLHPLPGCGALRAFETMQVGAFEITGCRVVQQPEQAAWVAMPQTQDRAGKYWPRGNVLDRQVKLAIEAAVLYAWLGGQEGGQA